jgi:hypothetical protein
MPSAGAAHGDRDVFGVRRRSYRFPFVEDTQPPDEVSSSIASRGAAVGSDGEVDLPSGLLYIVCDLDPRGTSADYEGGSLWKLLRVAVRA